MEERGGRGEEGRWREQEGEGRGGEGQGGVCSAGPCLHTACAGLALTSTEDHSKLIVTPGKHLQTREGNYDIHSQGGWEHLVGYNSVLPAVMLMGGRCPSLPLTQHACSTFWFITFREVLS